MAKDDNVIKFDKKKEDDETNYDLLKALLSSQKNQKQRKTLVIIGIISVFICISGLMYYRNNLGTKLNNNIIVNSNDCMIVGNTKTKIYHLNSSVHYKELLERNKYGENRICFKQEWEAVIAGYRKSKY